MNRPAGVTYDDLRAKFRWDLPQRLNMGVLCADRHPASAPAMIEVGVDGTRREFTFGDLTKLSNRFANALAGLGVQAGDRVAIVLPQRVETGIAHLALYKLGAIALPLSGLFGPDALRYRFGDAGPRAVLTDAAHLTRVAAVAAEIDAAVISADGPASPHHGFWELLQDASDRHVAAPTGPDTPALLIYTSGTTGAAKGALHGHRVLHGHLPGFELSHDFFPQADDVFWTPADWAWIGGLMDALMPAWFHGRPVVAAHRDKFDPEWALHMIGEHRVRNTFLPPTALKIMRSADVESPPDAPLRTIMCGGESLGEEVLRWAHEFFGITINEIYGQTEANYLVGNSSEVWSVRPGSMGRPYPGHDVSVLRADGTVAPADEVGQVAVRAPDPVMFLGYWGRPDDTKAKFTVTESGEWLLTGDLARADADGYLWYSARNDDVINSAGYRIGPGEIEECLMRHPAVAMAAAIGVPDDVRGEIVKAFIVPAEGHEPSPELKEEIRRLVKGRLAAYLYPRELEFVDGLPLTTTGKIRRNDLRQQEIQRREQSSQREHTS